MTNSRSILVALATILTLLAPLGISQANAQVKNYRTNFNKPTPQTQTQPRPAATPAPNVTIQNIFLPGSNPNIGGWAPAGGPVAPRTYSVYSRTDLYDSWTYQGTYGSLIEANQVAYDLRNTFNYQVFIR